MRMERLRRAFSFVLALGFALAILSEGAELRQENGHAGDVERWRPAVHFTPPRNFMNDPNGLVFFDGEYHLFYQHNPFGTRWGHMSWGHAVSTDLLRWRDLPVALREDGGWMAFSGSAVVDRDRRRLAAIYTAHQDARQVQHVAWSADRGRTWINDPANPVLDLGLKDFRDPKVFWHEGSSSWVMAVVVPDRRVVRFFGSRDLRRWEPRGSFGPAGSTQGVWECPDLVRLPIEGRPGAHAWTLIVSVNDGAPAGGSGVQYFTGTFDGHAFKADEDAASARWADHGPDFYAAQSWFHAANDAARPATWIGWMSNWRYANEEPTGVPRDPGIVPTAAGWSAVMATPATRGPWRGAMSLPRELALRSGGGGLRLVQRPVSSLATLRRSDAPDIELKKGGSAVDIGDAADVDVWMDVVGSAGRTSIELRTGPSEFTTITVDAGTRLVEVDRTRSGETAFHESFAAIVSAPIAITPRVHLRLLVDRSSVEVFAEDGAVVLTSRIFPKGAVRSLAPARGDSSAVSARGWRLQPAMAR